jgi:hypothetical protein
MIFKGGHGESSPKNRASIEADLNTGAGRRRAIAAGICARSGPVTPVTLDGGGPHDESRRRAGESRKAGAGGDRPAVIGRSGNPPRGVEVIGTR